jgi:3-hydroxybutyryl-CoA dehydrogenase
MRLNPSIEQKGPPVTLPEASRIASIGIVGAGTMGSGIGQVAAQSGFEVVLVDQAESWLDRGLDAIRVGLDRQVAKERIDRTERDIVLSRIEGSTKVAHLSNCDLVIEAVTESFATKAEVFGNLAEITGPDTILASNTSSISISAIAAIVPNPERVAGMHFFNPVPVMTVVEVIRGLQTSDETVAAVKSVASTMGKTPIEVADTPGFVANRLLMPMINEAVFCLDEGVAAAEDIDAVMRLGASHPMGPLALADLIGLDVCLSIMEVLHHDMGDSKYRPAPLLRKMVAAGRLGRKSGRGFYPHESSS